MTMNDNDERDMLADIMRGCIREANAALARIEAGEHTAPSLALLTALGECHESIDGAHSLIWQYADVATRDAIKPFGYFNERYS